jgi:hypothetical protein
MGLSIDDLRAEINKQERGEHVQTAQSLVDHLSKGVDDESDGANVDVLTYIRAEWGLRENPYPIQQFILKLIYGLPLDDRATDSVVKVINNTTIQVDRIDAFSHESVLDIGEYKKLKVVKYDRDNSQLVFEQTITGIVPGDLIYPRILTWDKFRENVIGAYTETEFLKFLYAEGPNTPNCRCNLNPELHNMRLGQQIHMIILRMGRRGTKTTQSQWIGCYTAYKILKKYNPQKYFKFRQEQPIRITLMATAREQAQELLAPARAAMSRSPYLKRFVESNSKQKLVLNTPYNKAHGLSSESGITIAAIPCSAKAARGPANVIALLEEFGAFYYELAGSNKSDQAVYEAIAPSTSDFTNPETGNPEGMVMIISTPLSKETYMYTLEDKIWKKEITNALVLHLPSAWLNSNLKPEILKNEYSKGADYFEREFEACYSDQISPAIPKELVEKCRKDPIYSEKIHIGEETYMGFDLGLKNDGTAIWIVAVNSLGEARVVHREYIRYNYKSNWKDFVDDKDDSALSIEKIAKHVDYLWTYWGVLKGLGDQWNSYGFASYLQSSARHNLELPEINSQYNDRIARNFMSFLSQGRVEYYEDAKDWDHSDSFLRELTKLQKTLSSGTPPRMKIHAPSIKGAHDDRFSALSRALFCAEMSIADRPSSSKSMSPQQEARLRTIRLRAETRKRQMDHARQTGRSPRR